MPGPASILLSQIRSGDVVLAGLIALLSVALLCLGIRFLSATPRPWVARVGQFSWQFSALLGLEQAYELMRARIPHETDLALMNAYRVLDLEWRYGFFVEQRVERFFLHYQAVMSAAYSVYGLGHVGITVGVLALIYFRRRQHYPFVRNLIMVTTAIALFVYYVYPTAPPRMLPNYGFVDPLILHHFVGAGGEQPDAYLYNPYAAMPSLHVGYALVVAWALFVAYRSRWIRLLAALYPVAMAASVVISGNHWLLDVLGAFVAVGLAGGLVKLGSVGALRVRRYTARLVSGRAHSLGLIP
jgi:membrane-associated phospholipid phosphatase